jgi:signal transduction histidine kinase
MLVAGPPPVLDAVAEINRIILSPDEPRHMMSEVSGAVAHALNYPFAGVLYFDRECQTLEVAGLNNRRLSQRVHTADVGNSGRTTISLSEANSREPIQALLRGHTYVTMSPETLGPPFLSAQRAGLWARYLGLKTGAALPLIARDQFAGSLFVGSQRDIDEPEKRCLEIFAGHVAVALEVWRLRRQAERRAAEEAALVRSARMLAGSQTGDVLRAIVQEASALTLDSRCCAFLQEEENCLRCVEVHGDLSDMARDARVPIEEGMLGEVFRTGTPMLVEDAPNSPLVSRKHAMEQMRIRSYMVVPMRWEQERIGVLTAAHPEPNRFTPDHLSLLATFADHAAIAIQNHRRYLGIHEQEQERAAHLRQVLSGQEAERRRIAVSIHDGPLQGIGANLLSIDRTRKLISAGRTEGAVEELAQMREELLRVVSDLRDVLSDLRPPLLEMQGLQAAAEAYLESFSKSHGIEGHVQSSLEERLPSTVELVFYRLMQEALTNVRKHAGATSAWVTLSVKDGLALMTITDNGRGFNPAATLSHSLSTGRIGLHSMWERLDLIGGTLDITSVPDQGTSITFSAPVGTWE